MISTLILATSFGQIKFDQKFQIDPNRLKLSVARKHPIDNNFSKRVKLVQGPIKAGPIQKYVFRQDLYKLVPPFAYPKGKLNADLLPNIEAAKLPMEDQGERGTCVLFATKFLLEYEYAREKNFKKSFRFNPEFLLWAVRNSYPNYVRDGAEYSNTQVGFGNFGCVNWNIDKTYSKKKTDYDPTYVPQAASQDKAKPLSTQVSLIPLFDHGYGLNDDEFCEILEIVNSGIPVGLSVGWGNEEPKPGKKPAGSWSTFDADGVQVLQYTGVVENAHAIVCVGYKTDPKVDGGGYMVFHNSWGDAYQGGYVYLTFRKIKEYCRNAYIALPKDFLNFG